MPKNCNAPFALTLFLMGCLGYFAVIDTSVRPAFTQLASNVLTGYFALSVPKKRDEDDAPTQ